MLFLFKIYLNLSVSVDSQIIVHRYLTRFGIIMKIFILFLYHPSLSLTYLFIHRIYMCYMYSVTFICVTFICVTFICVTFIVLHLYVLHLYGSLLYLLHLYVLHL